MVKTAWVQSQSLALSLHEKRFWTLVAEYDRLLVQMEWAIQQKDFDLLHSVQERQKSVWGGIEGLEGILSHIAESQEALKRLKKAHEKTHHGLEWLLMDLKKHSQKLAVASKMNLSVTKAYTQA
jgi:hypothetical protein